MDGPRKEPFYELANQLNHDHYEMIRKHLKGHYEGKNEDKKWIWDKQYIWFDEEDSND